MPQFSEEEAQRIFARAAERQHAAGDAPPGFSLDELTEIGRAAGLSPEHIAAAVTDVRAGRAEPPDVETFGGIPVTIRRTRVLPGPLTDEMWEGVVARLRRTFKSKGLTTEVGRTREWTGTNIAGGLLNLHATMIPVEGGTRVLLESSRAEEARQTRQIGLWMPAVTLAFFAVVGLADSAWANPNFWILIATVLGLLGAIPLISYEMYRRWGRRRAREFDGLLDQFDLLTRDAVQTPNPSPGVASSTPLPARLDLDELADAPDAESGAGRSRTRP